MLVVKNRFATDEECARFAEYLRWLEYRGRRASTTRSYRSDWQDLTLWHRRNVGEPFDGREMSTETVNLWRADSERKGKSSSTVLRRLAFARSYVAWLAEEGIVTHEVAENIRSEAKLKRAERAPNVMPAEDVHQLISHVDRRGCLRDQAIVYLLLDSGIRISELVELNVGDVDFACGELTVRTNRMRSFHYRLEQLSWHGVWANVVSSSYQKMVRLCSAVAGGLQVTGCSPIASVNTGSENGAYVTHTIRVLWVSLRQTLFVGERGRRY